MSRKKRRKYTKKRRRKNPIRNILPTPLLVVLGVFVAIFAALFAVWKAGQPGFDDVSIEVTGAPSLKVDNEVVDLGDIKLGKVVFTSFQVANVGDETLRFTSQPYVEVVEGC